MTAGDAGAIVRGNLLTAATSNLLSAAEAAIQAKSAELRKELGLRDLILTQILLVIVPDFFGTAVKAGQAHVVLWLLAILLFFVPQAMVVARLNRQMPLEGGLYEWARLAFNDGVGFLVAWNLWLFATLYTAVIGLIATTFLAYVLGPHAAWLASSAPAIVFSLVLFVALMAFVARFGLRVGKWVNVAGSASILIALGVLIAMPFAAVWRGTLAEYHPLRLVMPQLTLFHLSVFGKMTFGALVGLEYVAIFAGESRDPARTYAQSVRVAAPVIALLYVLGTSAIQAFVAPDSLDVIGAIPQALSRGAEAFGLGKFVVPLAIGLLFFNYLSSFNVNFAGNARLPMVAGWDHLLPQWFTRLHPKYKTPGRSILFVGAVAITAGVAALLGAGAEEAYELLLTWSFAFYGMAYLAMFAIPLLARKELGLRPAWWLRLAAASGFLMTLIFLALSAFPIVDVRNNGWYELKTILVVVGANLLGVLTYWMRKRARAAEVKN
jgi:amino acid transporter